MSRSLVLFAIGLVSILLLRADAPAEVGRGGGIVVLPNTIGPVHEEGLPRLRLSFGEIHTVTMQVPERLIGAPVAVDAGLAPAPTFGSVAGRFLTFTGEDLRRIFDLGVERLRTSLIDSSGDGLLIEIRPVASGGMVVDVW